ncbi:MAG: adenine phosphoribosyltransferase [Candidatus Omnitrophota bacterium]
MKDLKEYIRDIPDFPKKGIIFKDITPILKDKAAFKQTIDAFAEKVRGMEIDYIVSIEARGFILGSALAYKLGTGVIPVRKKGKLPYKTIKAEYALEYGTDVLEMHEDAVSLGDRVLIVDDVLATGGTALAVSEMLTEKQAEIVGISFLIELGFLNGIDKIKGYPVTSLIKY